MGPPNPVPTLTFGMQTLGEAGRPGRHHQPHRTASHRTGPRRAAFPPTRPSRSCGRRRSRLGSPQRAPQGSRPESCAPSAGGGGQAGQRQRRRARARRACACPCPTRAYPRRRASEHVGNTSGSPPPRGARPSRGSAPPLAGRLNGGSDAGPRPAPAHAHERLLGRCSEVSGL